MKHFDIAVVGGGLAGLSILYHLERAGKLTGKSIVLVDPERKEKYDRTWSFWEVGEGPFESIVRHRWDRLAFHGPQRSLTRDPAPYRYKLIRSDDFYAAVNPVIDGIGGLTRRLGSAQWVRAEGERVTFEVAGDVYSADLAFNSKPWILHPDEVSQPYLDQPFRGWIVETEEEVFDPLTATIMDFRTAQLGETRFFYVLPFSKRQALVELAAFTNDYPEELAHYDPLLTDYIRTHWTTGNYDIVHREAGIIPMTTYPFPVREGNLFFIGLGGGAGRPSSGYTFYSLQRQLLRIVEQFPSTKTVEPWPARHLRYDAALLRILQDGRLPGSKVFIDLFERNPTDRVLAFLNGESSLTQELRLMRTTNIPVFGRAFAEEFFK